MGSSQQLGPTEYSLCGPSFLTLKVIQKELGHIMQHQLLEAKHEQNNRGLGGL